MTYRFPAGIARTRPLVLRTARAAAGAAALLLVASQTGCLVAAAAAGTGATVAYVRGDTEAVLQGDPPRVAAAAERAANQLKLSVVSANSTGLDGKLIARTASDAKVEVTIKGEGPGTSKVWIRVGMFGDTAIQQNMLDAIRQHLAADARATAGTTAADGE
jgi:hypothetical protein